jgi:hypothetical protein
MGQFANAAVDDTPPSKAFLWLAGLLEAEGSFLKPAPSGPGCPIVSCRMTDRDVMERVAAAFGTTLFANDKGQYKTEFAVTARGSRAANLMADVRPFMGERRRRAIDAALERYTPRPTKLSYETAEEIRRRHAKGESAALLARRFRVSHPTIRQLVNGQFYRQPPPSQWRDPADYLCDAICDPPGELSLEEFYWLAGWLEGEGSFIAPPPSDPRRPRISGVTRDRDVITEVARLLDVSPAPHDRRETRARDWSPTWGVLKRGRGAVRLMRALRPLMGTRRTEQIDEALLAAKKAGSPAFSQRA